MTATNTFALASPGMLLPWLGFLCAALYLYFGTWYAARDRKRVSRGVAPAAASQPPRVAWSLICGLAAFFLVDGIVFHTHLYPSIVSPDSYAGNVQLLMARERARPVTSAKTVMVLGDSRIGEGFSDRYANEIAGPGWEFVNGYIGGSDARVWYYMLREMDPDANRYSAVVIPVEYRDIEPQPATPGRAREALDHLHARIALAITAPLLRYADCLSFPLVFGGWSDRCRAFASCILRGVSYEADFVDLIEHPVRRHDYLRASGPSFRKDEPPPKRGNLLAVRYDASTGVLKFPPGLPRLTRQQIERTLTAPADNSRWPKERERSVGAILRRYNHSQTRIMFVQLPRGPFIRPARSPDDDESTISNLVRNDRTILLGRDQFRDLEAPRYFVDGYHANYLGRKIITERLTRAVVERLAAPGPGEPSSRERPNVHALQ